MTSPAVPRLHGPVQDLDVLVVGAGFAGINAALAAAVELGGRGTVGLVAPDPWLTVRPRLYEAGPEALRADILGPLAAVGARFIAGTARGLYPVANCVELEDGRLLGYRRMILAAGSRMRATISGALHAHSIDDHDSACRFEAWLRANASRAPTIAVIGAGLSGIELVTALRGRIASIAGAAAQRQARLMLVESGTSLGGASGPAAQKIIRSALDAVGVELRLGVRVDRIGAGSIVLSTGEQLPVDAAVLCAGFAASPLAAQTGGVVDDLGRVSVDGHLEVPESPGMFAAGDVAAALAAPGRLALQSCQHAIAMGRIAGLNAARDILGGRRRAYAQPFYLTCLDLGPAGALITSGFKRRSVLARGRRGKAMKRFINEDLIYPPGADRQAVARAARAPSWLELRLTGLIVRLMLASGAVERRARRLRPRSYREAPPLPLAAE
jgi:NADH dehydrogenase